MAASDITENLKTALESLSTYDGTPTVELERLYTRINGRYPFVVLNGPYADVETQTHNTAHTVFEYVIQYFVDYNDEDQDEYAITYVTRNVAGDIIKQILLDTTRGGYAIFTRITGFGNGFDGGEEGFDYYVYVVIEVETRLEATDPSLWG